MSFYVEAILSDTHTLDPLERIRTAQSVHVARVSRRACEFHLFCDDESKKACVEYHRSHLAVSSPNDPCMRILFTMFHRSRRIAIVSRIMTTRSYSSSGTVLDNHVDQVLIFLQDQGAIGLQHGPIHIEATRYVAGQVPAENSKIVHFQRHGQGYHNFLYAVLNDAGAPVLDVYHPDPLQNPFVRPEMVDAPLTELGRQQCWNQRPHASQLTPEVLIVSPLHRAIQTAQITFGEFSGKIPFLAHEECREEMGLLVCNKRRPLSETIQEFPQVDFSIMVATANEEDTLWNPNQRECPKAQSKRIYNFLTKFVRHRSEQELAVVGHSAWLFNMCHTVLDCDDEMKSWFGTSEIRSMQLKFYEKE